MTTQGDLWLRFNYWFVSNSASLRKWWVLILLGFAVFFIVFSLTNIIVYSISFPREQRLIVRMIDASGLYTGLREQFLPQALATSGAAVVNGTGTKKDFLVKVTNPNEQWVAEKINYTFSLGAHVTEEQSGSVIPAHETYLATYGEEVASDAGSSVSFNIVDVQWKRVSPLSQSVVDVFSVDEVQYRVSSQGQPVRNVGTVTATLSNESFTGFWQAPFTVVLMNGSTPVGISRVYIEQFEERTTRPLSVQWSPAPSRVDSARIIPEVDLYEQTNIMTAQ
ncbi:MAG: hypothetical protein A2898_04855 [Candidatus Kerfeldbacteria bacterium RIFCSPLOWO2_01_FULL_48_11]|uniref:Uncharacterized protein n=1 Tax=Candidatus Kerfeldbacteria bacterium RIFCSPLOWO2_01_FULL_48_11 TaxID=1798543 RepID=A0A1G2B117_9BACT|nr:MAG: hypothetical protein UY34_C0032G0002 [Parcubacteria group bacterium GW2011_GWA2_48_9]KKW15687.1 MAG: hypothetical protein UY52_C0016G0064 [Parcubacteria group bacterium GW2011_GWC2_49_9]OGY82883.1 MAG: hypothetical protein A2898_04855 [Candidatus Kerfeldbacteria bacterium RIFCSPLOWO2_01_FULL_48_11]HCJ52098.1 hypothetical protein [Candidatus Kerfeldbacteria bacterium]HCM68430.1 hypothetical protein [Candidatus Kerfeldbacteria bacterium]